MSIRIWTNDGQCVTVTERQLIESLKKRNERLERRSDILIALAVLSPVVN